MNRILISLLVFAVVTLIDFYGYQGVKYISRDLSPNWQLFIKILYWSISVFVIISIIGLSTGLFSRSSPFWRMMFMSAIFVNYLPKIILMFFMLIDDGWRLVQWVIDYFSDSKQSVPDVGSNGDGISRSDFIVKSGTIAAGLPIIAGTFGIISGAHDYRVRRKTIYYPNLPKEFDGIKVGQISDIHSGSFFNKVAVQGGVDLLNSEKPDITFFTGDLVNNLATEVRDYIDVFDKVKAPLGVHSILGNHDYGLYLDWESEKEKRKNIQDVIHAHKELGWNIMLNENRDITVDGQSIGLLGVENWGEGFIKVGDLKKAYTGSEHNDFKILLSHDPSHWRDEVLPGYKDIDLTLSGHTHGMQFGIEIGDFQWSPVQYRYKEWGGLYTEGNQHIYVNRGYGYLGYPGRVGILPEITILELKKG